MSSGRKKMQVEVSDLAHLDYVPGDLTEKEEIYASFVANGVSFRAAARQAGYAQGTIETASHAIAKRPQVARRIALLQQAKIDAEGMPIKTPKSFVLQQAVQILRRSMQGEPVLDKNGDPVGEWQFNDRGAIRSLELISDVCGYRVKNVNVKIEHGDMEDLTKGELVTQIIKMILRAGISQEVLEGLTTAVNGAEVEEAQVVA